MKKGKARSGSATSSSRGWGKKKRRVTKTRQPRFPGLLITLLFLLILSLPLAFLYVIPMPQTGEIGTPTFENFSRAPGPSLPKEKKDVLKREETPVPAPIPRIAIIIDDMGYDPRIDKRFIGLEAPLSFAFLPYAPFTPQMARLAKAKNKDVLVHLPMEPDNPALDPGPGVLRLDMDFYQLLETLKKDIRQVPGAIGANNHMGSSFTTDSQAMKYVMVYLRQIGFFFIDSRTTKYTVAEKVARRIGVPCGERTVFLDDIPREDKIVKELNRLVEIAKQKGEAIAIGHPYRATLKTLYKELPLIQRRVKLVPVHLLVH